MLCYSQMNLQIPLLSYKPLDSNRQVIFSLLPKYISPNKGDSLQHDFICVFLFVCFLLRERCIKHQTHSTEVKSISQAVYIKVWKKKITKYKPLYLYQVKQWFPHRSSLPEKFPYWKALKIKGFYLFQFPELSKELLQVLASHPQSRCCFPSLGT